MKRIKGKFNIFLASIAALSFFVCLISSALIPINNLTLKVDFIDYTQSASFFIFLTTFLSSKIFYKNGREKTVNFFKNFLKKQKKEILEKDLPEADCGCKKK